jgi:tripartite ATP-independent transporter DctP family solute receptor
MERPAKHLLLSLMIPAVLLCASAQAADVTDRNIKFSYVLSKDHPYGLGAAKFAELVDQKSGGKMKVKTYSDGQLGGEAQTISATQGGIQEMTLVSSAPLVGIVKEYALFDFPYLFENEKEADAVLDGPVGKSLLDKLSSKNLIGLCYWENGFRNVTNSKRPIAKADDLQGLKIRTMQNPVYTDLFNTLGANAVPMAMTEVYTALETKAIDAQENPYQIIYTSKFNEVQKYVSATKHAYAPAVVMVSKKFWDKLTPDERKILQDSCAEARDYERKTTRDANAKVLKELQAKGMAFNEIPPAEIAKMRAKAKPVVDKYSKEVGEDLVKQTYAEIDKVRQQK